MFACHSEPYSTVRAAAGIVEILTSTRVAPD
jgi:hypothetical protein